MNGKGDGSGHGNGGLGFSVGGNGKGGFDIGGGGSGNGKGGFSIGGDGGGDVIRWRFRVMIGSVSLSNYNMQKVDQIHPFIGKSEDQSIMTLTSS